LSIFTQDCPRCGTTNSASSRACACGHVFAALPESSGAAQMLSQEEEAYEAYLSARLEQARLAAEKAIELLSQNPTDRENVAQAEHANRQLAEINHEYETQLANVEAAQAEAERRQAAETVAQARRAAEAASRLRDLQTRWTEEPVERTPAPQAITADEHRPFNPPKIKSLSSPAVSAALQANEPEIPASMQPARAVTRARSGTIRRNSSEAIQARRIAQQMIAQKAEAIAARQAGSQSMPNALRESISQKADQVHEDARRKMANISGDLAGAMEALDSRLTHFSAPSLLKGEARHCPICADEMAVGASNCKCGYEIGAGAMPSLTLDHNSF